VLPPVKALVFDVFGTVVDWRTCVVREAERLAGGAGADVDWGSFADDWRREGYLAPIMEIVRGSRPYSDVEVLLGDVLGELLSRVSVDLDDRAAQELLSVWRRLEPWADAREGLERLRRDHVIAPLSNGSFALLTEMAKRAGLPWDCILSTELFGSYKPDPATYRGAARLLGVEPAEVMMVAAHGSDLRAAAAVGLRTAYVPRPAEWGPDAAPPAPPDPDFDVVAADFNELATALGREESRS